jgi:hypothetical protein
VGGDAAFVGEERDTEQAGTEQAGTEQAGTEQAGTEQAGTEQAGTEHARTEHARTEQAGTDSAPNEGRGLPDMLRGYLLAEQRLGRVDGAADVDAAVTLVVGTIHGEILPRVMFAPAGTRVATAPGLAGRVASTVLRGIAPGVPR